MNLNEPNDYIEYITEKANELNLTLQFSQDIAENTKVFIRNSTEGRQRIRGITIPTSEDNLMEAMNWVAHI